MMRILLFILLLVIIAVLILLFYQTSVTQNIDDFVYELPYKAGKKFKIVQGYGGLFSHKNIAALDFRMPVGTPICAARGGIVYSYKSSSDEGGITSKYKNKANYLIIQHDDGSFGCYWHLKKDGVLVTRGRVKTGQQIGISGATGQVLQPHLHFSVKSQLTYDMNSFVRTRFRTNKGIMLLERGVAYECPNL